MIKIGQQARRKQKEKDRRRIDREWLKFKEIPKPLIVLPIYCTYIHLQTQRKRVSEGVEGDQQEK